ncbi:hypothetical protein ACFOU2_20735 [Bacillus songklensis]|uniref:Uncharacterized protein n=1 Tax=Bacillus songklensis TaxID=1069116 RepID=A0ABV8B687_9BACI
MSKKLSGKQYQEIYPFVILSGENERGKTLFLSKIKDGRRGLKVIYDRDLELEEFIDSLSTRIRDVFKYMRQEYECITNFGENYNPEEHDPIVAHLASNKFEIKTEHASQIYINVQMMIREFYRYRRGADKE